MLTNISIHAPAKGATGGKVRCTGINPYFNPRSREGSDSGADVYSYTLTISIHAPAKGATIKRSRCNGFSKWFQSTLPRRERRCTTNRNIDSLKYISIHAPAKGATLKGVMFQTPLLFQSTLPRRERQHLLTSFRLQYGYSLFHLTNKI